MTNLTSYKVLSFDCYGTLVDWESGLHSAFLSTVNPPVSQHTKPEILHAFHSLEKEHQSLHPDLPYSQLLTKIHPLLATKLGIEVPAEQKSKEFGDSVGSWPAFPDTVSALQRLQKHFKLVILSNTDRISFSATNSTQMRGIQFDAILTAQDIGSYKPDKRNFEYMLNHVQQEWGIAKDQVLQTAQSQFHDHHPAKDMGIKSAWIVRPGAIMGEQAGKEIFDWKFDTMGEMADAVERELEGEASK
ncbi:MAG: hypothetical protein Q9222_003361 [Ikaeria aurantiellina]